MGSRVACRQSGGLQIIMGFTRENLAPFVRHHYDAQKRTAAPTPIAVRVKKGIKSSQFAAIEFANLCERAGLSKPATEATFHPTRKWRLDYYWPAHRLALEVEGGVFIGGGHTSGSGFAKDLDKYNSLTIIGVRLLRCTPSQLLMFDTIDMVRRAMRGAR